jgi:hypothetical protein
MSPSPNAAQRIIAKFGGQSAMAKTLNRPQTTISSWARSGTIPSKWHQQIIEAGTPLSIFVAPSDFLPTPKVSTAIAAIPDAKWPGVLDVGGVEIECYVLSDSRRVISRTGALRYLAGGKGGGNLESYLRRPALQPFLPKDLRDHMIEINMSNVVNKTVRALTASGFIDICRAYSRGRDMGALTTTAQVDMAIRASSALAAFAKTGIEAAIDEATGYQFERADDALRVKLKLFLEDEMRPWEKTFPDELWVQFGRLTRWKGAIQDRPKYWGKLVNELIYSYLDPDVYKWLRENAPKPRHGQNYHSWLSSQYGLKKLVEHIWMVIGMATVCHDMRELRDRMAEKFGRSGIQFRLYLPQ